MVGWGPLRSLWEDRKAFPHSMNPGTKNFAEADRNAARNMPAAADAAGVKRIIDLGR